jgi:outer membrane protein insertion porin family
MSVSDLNSSDVSKCGMRMGTGHLLRRIPHLFFILLNLFLFVPDQGEAVTAGRIGIQGLHSIERDEFLNLLGLETGGAVNRELIKKGIKRAFLKGIFEDIAVSVADGNNPDVLVSVREREFIRKIHFKGDYPVSRKTIAGIFLLKEDEIMRYDLLPQAEKELKKSLALYGFPRSDVRTSVLKDKKNPYRVNIELRINAGAPEEIKNLHFTGTELDLTTSLKTKPGDVFNQIRLNDDMKRISEHLKKMGYYHPVVGPWTFRDGVVEIPVNTGKKLIIEIRGNRIVSAKNLIQESVSEIGTFSEEVVSEAADRMLSLYRNRGYASAQIAPVISEDEKNIHLHFFVFEGEKYRVGRIRFAGSKLPHSRLLEIMKLKKGGLYSPDLLEKDRNAIEEIYGALGYLETEVKEFETKINKNDRTVDLFLSIYEGTRTEIVSIEITGTDQMVKEDLMGIIGIRRGDPYNEVDISEARFRILDYYGSLGFPNIDVEVYRDIETNRASLKFAVLQGSKKFMGKTVIAGNKRTKYTVIERELQNREGEPYSFRALSDERQRLYKLGLFTDVDIETVEAEGETRDILIRVQEANAGALEFGFGYAEYEKYRAFLEVSYRNLWGMDRQGLLRTEVSGLERRLILQYDEPWFIGYPLPFKALFLHERKREINLPDRNTRYKLEKNTVTAGFEKKISNLLKADLYYEFSLAKTTDVQPDVILSRDDVGTLAISSIKPSLVFDSRDNPFDPSRGLLAGIGMKIASPLLFSDANFGKLNVYGSTFFRLSRRAVFAVAARAGLALGLGKPDELPIVERFFLGGRSTVRGYEQDSLGPKGADGNPTGGNAFVTGNLELRTSVGRGFSLVPFFDMGNVWLKINDMNVTDLKYTTGIGLRYDTPVGPLRVDYGIKLQRERGESGSALHFSIGHAF